ncbi:hypothetical protein B0J14DRAFT_559299 [Halenospora varia]|nr:hypothetical protein B0J14DRAFT_559299 [Halenospora varia]
MLYPEIGSLGPKPVQTRLRGWLNVKKAFQQAARILCCLGPLKGLSQNCVQQRLGLEIQESITTSNQRQQNEDMERRNRERALREIAFQRKRKDEAPQHLDNTRQRPLSLKFLDLEEEECYRVVVTNVDDGSERNEIHRRYKHPQKNCKLLNKLTPGARQRIWRLVMSYHTITISRGQQRLVHTIQDQGGQRDQIQENDPIRISSLIKTCRQTYNETIQLLYTTNHFVLEQNDNLSDLHTTLLPQRFSTIRTLTMQWQIRDDETFQRNELGNFVTSVAAPWDIATWEHSCSLLKKMYALRELTIHVRGPFMVDQNLKDMLEFLRHIRVAKEHKIITVPWPRIATVSPAEEFLDCDFCTVRRRDTRVMPDEDTGPGIE